VQTESPVKSQASISGQPRAIVHLDLDAFFAAVEVLENPKLKGQPVVVGGRPSERGVVAAASYPARAFGIRSAMPMYRALQLCPQTVICSPRHRLYGRYSRQVMEILHETCPLVEQMSIDEAYLDLTEQVDAWDEAVEIARRLRERVLTEVRLSASLGVAANKLVAKVASDHDKPGGLTVVRPGEEASFLAPLPVRVLWGVGPVTERKLAVLGVRTVGELAALPETDLVRHLGQHGLDMARQAQGVDQRPVSTEHERKSISQERTFSRDLRDIRALRKQLWQMSQGVARRLEGADLAAGTIAVKLRYADFSTITRQLRLAVPTQDAKEIYRAALVLLRRGWQRGRPIRLLGVTGRGLTAPGGQLPLL